MFSWIAKGLANIVTAIKEGIAGIGDWISSLGDSILDGLLVNFDDLSSWITNLGTSIGNWFSDVGTWFGNLGTDIGNWFGDLGSNLGNWLSYLNPFDENFFGNKLIELLSNALSFLFTPSEDILTELQEKVSSKFGFINSIKLAVDDIQQMIENIENGSAKLTVDIDSEYYKGEATILDLSWYSKFKYYGDLVFTGFAYVLFILRMYKAVPNILSGLSSGAGIISRGGGDD